MRLLAVEGIEIDWLWWAPPAIHSNERISLRNIFCETQVSPCYEGHHIPSHPSRTFALTNKRKTVACERREATLVVSFSSTRTVASWACSASRVPVSAVMLRSLPVVVGPLVAVVVRHHQLFSFFLCMAIEKK